MIVYMNPTKIKKIVRNMTDLGILIREKRQQVGLTQAKAAALCNVSTPFFSMLENGKKSLRVDKLLSVLNGLGLEILIEDRGISLGE